MPDALNTLDKIPGLQAVLDQCSHDVQALIKWPVSVHFQISVHKITLDELKSVICRLAEVTWKQIQTTSKAGGNVLLAKHAFVYLARKYYQLTDAQIAAHTCNERSNVSHVYKVAQQLLDVKDAKLLNLVMQVEQHIVTQKPAI